jgi:hypothetical protein
MTPNFRPRAALFGTPTSGVFWFVGHMRRIHARVGALADDSIHPRPHRPRSSTSVSIYAGIEIEPRFRYARRHCRRRPKHIEKARRQTFGDPLAGSPASVEPVGQMK